MPAWTTTVRYNKQSAITSFSLARGLEFTYANDAVGANQLDEAVLDGALGIALAIRVNVAEIADVAGVIRGSTVVLAVGVNWMGESAFLLGSIYRGSFEQRTVRAGRGAAVGVVTKSVNVEAALSVGVVAGHVPGDGGGSRLGLLLKDDGAIDLAVTTEDGN